ncbi:helix-turn-helix transcriptional regulator [Bosea sp. (in: a-proteobacteria)]|jgi:transcriptional regulator with XRE-family HTH domain|uniref:helix-turn-helix domain-containing protein n=1 Tax=Bosea sp. (in: a-proteobacteria) TaxID=1871050 RepID=UPI0025C1F841|nr:helix-turn-helix transcriptional regulator [Bosea sp. (in: a-proteobacteria)]MBR3191888.1 helix-turn-helix transcriptional regulator [Bosea sp. (in: a-proteobacteria)]
MEKERRSAVHREIGRRLKEHRDAMGRNQEFVAAILGVTQQQVANYECGKHRLSVIQIVLLSDAFGVGRGYFLDTVAHMIHAGSFSHPEQSSYSGDPAAAAERRRFDRAYKRLKAPEDRALGLDLLEFVVRRRKQMG